jgi:hypothetical protein
MKLHAICEGSNSFVVQNSSNFSKSIGNPDISTISGEA